MSSINTFVIVGNVTKDFELRYTSSGTASATFTVAVNNIFYDRDGNKQEETDFIMVTSFGKQAENDAKFLRKGSQVAVSGRIRSWYKADEKKGGYNFHADTVQYLGRGSSAEPAKATSKESDEWLEDHKRAEREYKKMKGR